MIIKGIVVNRFAWAMPHLYVMIAARRLPWFIWSFLAVVLSCSSVYFMIQFRAGRMREKLPGFLRHRVRPVGTDDGHSPTVANGDDHPLSSDAPGPP